MPISYSGKAIVPKRNALKAVIWLIQPLTPAYRAANPEIRTMMVPMTPIRGNRKWMRFCWKIVMARRMSNPTAAANIAGFIKGAFVSISRK